MPAMNEDLKILAGMPPTRRSDLKLKTLAEFERDYIEMVITICQNNIPRAAKILGISASTLYRKRANWAENYLHKF